MINPRMLTSNFQAVFESAWYHGVTSQTKLSFYSTIKKTFGYEPYLNTKESAVRKSVSRFRCSAHQLNVETARYTNTIVKKESRKHSSNNCNKLYNGRCHTCTFDSVALLNELLFADIIVEDELHVLRCCTKYEHIRAALSNNIKNILWNDSYIEALFDKAIVEETSHYIQKITKLRLNK